MGWVEDVGDVVELVVELLLTGDGETGLGLGEVSRELGRHFDFVKCKGYEW